MPGAPPVRVVSVTERRWAPFTRNEIVLPTACSFSVVPAASAAVFTALSWVQAPPVRRKSMSSGLPKFQ